MQTSTIDTGRLKMRYQLSGPPDAPVVCLLHCLGADLNYWDPHMEAFSGLRVLRFDTRGHGHSDAPNGPYTLDMLAQDVVALCDVLDINKVHCCGVSLGGQIAQTFALNNPTRIASLTLVNTTCEYTQAQAHSWQERAESALRDGMQAMHEPLLQRWFTRAAAEQNIPGYRYMTAALSRFTATSFAAATAAMCELDTTSRLPEISVPAMVIATANDPGAPREVSEKMTRVIANCRLHWLEPAEHLASLEHPETFNNLMREFLSEHTSTDKK